MGHPQQLELPMQKALDRSELGMERSVNRANRVVCEWSGQALGLLIAFAIDHGKPFLVEQAREYATTKGLPDPPDQRSWGAVVRRAAAAGRIQRVGEAPAASSNLSLKRLWRFNR